MPTGSVSGAIWCWTVATFDPDLPQRTANPTDQAQRRLPNGGRALRHATANVVPGRSRDRGRCDPHPFDAGLLPRSRVDQLDDHRGNVAHVEVFGVADGALDRQPQTQPRPR
jgi:hypothetical protein